MQEIRKRTIFRRGFSLIEIMIAVVIIGILVAMITPQLRELRAELKTRLVRATSEPFPLRWRSTS